MTGEGGAGQGHDPRNRFLRPREPEPDEPVAAPEPVAEAPAPKFRRLRRPRAEPVAVPLPEAAAAPAPEPEPAPTPPPPPPPAPRPIPRPAPADQPQLEDTLPPVSFVPEVHAGEKLLRVAYRMGLSGSTLSRPFGRPLRPRLLATVESPLAGNRPAGIALRAGHFLIHGVRTPLAEVDFAAAAPLPPPLERAVHGFTWLRDLAAGGTAQQGAAVAERILRGWLDANRGTNRKGAGWRVGHAGHRLLAWLVHAPLILSGTDKPFRGRVLAAIADHAAWLDRQAGRADNPLEALAGWCAVTAAGLLLPDGQPRRLHGEAGLGEAVGELVGRDGGVLSRSPLAQIEAIELLVELAACYRATRRPLPQHISAMLQLLVPPLLTVLHTDGGLGSWQGAGAVPASRIAALVSASTVRARPLIDARQWGYQRIEAGINDRQRTVLLMDAAPPPLARHSLYGCASTLAVELSAGPHRIAVNCGGAAFAGGQVPTRLEQNLRATAAHSTLVLGDANSTAVKVAGKLGAGVSEVEVDRRRATLPDGREAVQVEASHDGYGARLGLVHRRIVTLSDDGTLVLGEDRLEPTGRKGRRAKVPYGLRFHLGPGIEPALLPGGDGALLPLPDGTQWVFQAPGHPLMVDESLWVDGEGQPHPVQQLVLEGALEGAGTQGGAEIAWRFEKVRMA
ncbi:heparinase II/III family protein [Croceibacterium mercuriale]|uniref:heparinase II/III family protein n=1 Tax=Croceibacterium mercuriale TaxID=1572751 RepID=UPI00068B6741|nr:heparinase II/III family protein [Croceibacterium mercuriale]